MDSSYLQGVWAQPSSAVRTCPGQLPQLWKDEPVAECVLVGGGRLERCGGSSQGSDATGEVPSHGDVQAQWPDALKPTREQRRNPPVPLSYSAVWQQRRLWNQDPGPCLHGTPLLSEEPWGSCRVSARTGGQCWHPGSSGGRHRCCER